VHIAESERGRLIWYAHNISCDVTLIRHEHAVSPVDIMNQDCVKRDVVRPDSGGGHRGLICTTDDVGEVCYLADSGLSLLVNIMRISQHWGRRVTYADLDEDMQREVRLWSRAVLTEDDNAPGHRVSECCRELLDGEGSAEDR